MRPLAALLLLSWLAALAGYAFASLISGPAHDCRAAGAHWLIFTQSCRY